MKEYRRIGPDHAKTILMVGTDDMAGTNLLRSIQKETPYHVARAFTGEQAIEFIGMSKVDLMVLGSYLPDTTELNLYDKAAKTNGQQHIPTILLNAHLSQKELLYRNIICLTAPLTWDHFLQTLDTLLLFPQCPVAAV